VRAVRLEQQGTHKRQAKGGFANTMRKLIASFITVCVFVPVVAQAQVTQVCGDSAPPTINVPDGTADKAAAKCLSAITKSSGKFVQTKLKSMGKCLSDRVVGACPSAKDLDKIQKAAIKGRDKIAKSCGATELAALPGTTYSSGFTGTEVASCLLSQNNVSASLILAKLNGITDGFSAAGGLNSNLEGCADALNKQTGKYVPKILKTINKCVDLQAKAGAVGDVGPVCAPSYAAGAYVAPTEPKTAGKIEKTILKAVAAMDKDCTVGAEGPFGYLPRLHACPYAATVEDLKECLVCDGADTVWAEVNAILTAQYAETGTQVTSTIQAAHDAASPGDKILIPTGGYNEEVTITTDDLAFVGCGGATDERPIIEPGGGSGTNRGFQAVGVDDLVFQSLQPNNWDQDGIFITGVSEVDFSNNVTFRDIVADGQINSRYIIFPAFMDGVIVELNEVFNCDDAALYVGKSTNIVTRYNVAYDNVAGIEIENCDNAETYNNYSHNNTGGMLVFLDSTLLPRSNDNGNVFHNYIVDNNTPNFAPSGFVQNIPQGTGILFISPTNSTLSYNHVAGNQAMGVVLIDQAGVNVFAGDPWPLAPGEQGDVCIDNVIGRNTGLDTNGTIPDPDIGFGITLAAVFNQQNLVPLVPVVNTCNEFDANEPSGVAYVLGPTEGEVCP